MLRLLYRLLLQQLDRYRARINARRQRAPRSPVGNILSRNKRTATIAALVLSVLAGVAVFQQFELGLHIQSSDKSVADLTVELDFTIEQPLVAYLERWPEGVEVIEATGKVVQLAIINSLFVPHMQIVEPGSIIEVVNHDSILHNAHVLSENDTVFNVATPLQSISVRKPVTATGVLQIRCDLHPVMRGWLFVPPTEHYSIQADSANVRWQNVTPGTYRVKAWQGGEYVSEEVVKLKPKDTKTIRLKNF